jgi:acetyl-CoA carboxylase biotin carboxyl carrier protein
MPLKHSDIEALVDLFGKSGWDEMHLEIDGEEFFLSTDSRARAASPAPAGGVAAESPAAAPAASAHVHAPAPSPAAPSAHVASARPTHWVAIVAPNLGTFYRAPSPDAPPYVKVGDTVTPETEVCLIEVMKLFTTVRAGLSGTVREIAAEDGKMVEYGADLLWIEPA